MGLNDHCVSSDCFQYRSSFQRKHALCTQYICILTILCVPILNYQAIVEPFRSQGEDPENKGIRGMPLAARHPTCTYPVMFRYQMAYLFLNLIIDIHTESDCEALCFSARNCSRHSLLFVRYVFMYFIEAGYESTVYR